MLANYTRTVNTIQDPELLACMGVVCGRYHLSGSTRRHRLHNARERRKNF